MGILRRVMITMSLSIIFFSSANAPAQSMQTTEEKFQDVFITAGYATAFGAALGAASLSFFDNPSERMQYIAIGASLGFIAGSVFGGYMVFSPTFAAMSSESDLLAVHRTSSTESRIIITPNFNPESKKIDLIGTSWTLAQF